jgi:hypothetical protein
MIRRGFWLAAGAVLGVTGYRKVTRIAQALTGREKLPGQQRRGRTATALTPAVRSAIQATATSRLALTSRGAERPEADRPPTAIARAASAAGFIRDVREGMAEYRDLHRADFDHTLGSRSDRISPVESRQGRREP